MSPPRAFFAHSSPRTDKSDWQPLKAHLEAVADMAGGFAGRFGAAAFGRVAGALHDLGKYSEEFQLRLSGEHPRVDHSSAGARVACERFGPRGWPIAYAVAGHHAGLANGRDGERRTSLRERLDGAHPALHPAWAQEVALPQPQTLGLPTGFQPVKPLGSLQLSLLTRMTFSALVDADYLDTERYYVALEGRASARDRPLPSLPALREALDATLRSFAADTPVRRMRAEILSDVRGLAQSPQGVFSLTVPTGGGKTLTSLAFALDHAICHGLERVIVVIPYTSIVEQTAAAFRAALGPLGERAVLEHHSAFDASRPPPGEPDRDQAALKLRLAMENWDAPVVVTTAVQFLESLFAAKPSAARKLHRIAGSVVILDEAQTLPLRLLRPTVATLEELARNYRTSLVLCTATQPSLGREQGLADGFERVVELAPEPARLYESLRRVSVHTVGALDDESLAERVRAREQVLCIVNNRRHAASLFDACAGEHGLFHLSTLMCAIHRRQVLARVRERLAAGEPCRLVSTSLVEAGVDLDFPTVLRAEAGLDAIAQAAGRCNREGRLAVGDAEVLVFATKGDDWAPPPDLREFAQVAREVLRGHRDDPLGLPAIDAYFQALYWQRGPAELDRHDLLGLLRASRPESLPFETIERLYRVIESHQRPLIVPYDEHARSLIDSIGHAERAGGLGRALQPYVVQVPPRNLETLLAAGAVRTVAPERFGEQFRVLVNTSLYRPDVGLRVDDPGFIDSDKLCW
jgi:CRISPR-associated endonuclease/helicase Cas3